MTNTDSDLPAIPPGNFRNVCPHPDCRWWMEVPAMSLDWLIKEAAEHRATHAKPQVAS